VQKHSMDDPAYVKRLNEIAKIMTNLQANDDVV
jgi:hypothetical protein